MNGQRGYDVDFEVCAHRGLRGGCSEALWQALFVPTATSSLRGYTRTRNYLILSVMDKVTGRGDGGTRFRLLSLFAAFLCGSFPLLRKYGVAA